MASSPIPIRPYFKPAPPSYPRPAEDEPPAILETISSLSLLPHPEGGYFAVTDIDKTRILSPHSIVQSCSLPSSSSSSSFPVSTSTSTSTPTSASTTTSRPTSASTAISTSTSTSTSIPTRHLSSTIFYFLTPSQPAGHFHRCKSRIIHSLHRGRAQYILIHPATRRIETFIVGHDILAGEKLQWVVEGDIWKATVLLPDDDNNHNNNPSHDAPSSSHATPSSSSLNPSSNGMLITETVAPGFEYEDHEFLTRDRLEEMLGPETASQLQWLIKP